MSEHHAAQEGTSALVHWLGASGWLYCWPRDRSWPGDLRFTVYPAAVTCPECMALAEGVTT